MSVIDNFFSQILGDAKSVVYALLLLIAAFVVSAVAKTLVKKLLGKVKLFDKAAGEKDSYVDSIAKFVKLIVFLLFVPGIFSILKIENAADPIVGLLNSVWGYVPNVLAAVIILIIGFQLAKAVRSILSHVLEKLPINKLQEKAGIEVKENDKFSSVIAYIAYVLILIPLIITALTVLKIEALSVPAVAMLSTVFKYIPTICIALVVVLVGVYVAKLASQIVTRLIASSGLDKKISEFFKGEASKKFCFSKVVGGVVNAVLIIFFAVEAVNLLNLDVLSGIGSAVIGYIPSALAAALILGVAIILGAICEKALEKNGMKFYALLAKYSLLVVAVFMVLSQLGIAPTIVNSAFIIVIAAVAVAFAVAFGVGGRDFAGRMLKKAEEKFDEDKKSDK